MVSGRRTCRMPSSR